MFQVKRSTYTNQLYFYIALPMNLHTVFPSGYTNLYSHQQQEVQDFLYSMS